MNFKHKFSSWPYGVIALVLLIFSYNFFLKGLIPFPGDLLISDYMPWKTYSFLGYNPGTFPSKLQYFDVIRQIYPWKTLSLSLLSSHIFPLWNPYNFSGSPLFANSQSAVLYPLNILYAFLPQYFAWTLLVILQPCIASVFTYMFMQKIGVSKKSALISAIAYGFCLFMSVFLEYNTLGHVIGWLPLFLYSIELLIEKRYTKSIILFTIAFVSSFFAGHLQIFGYAFLFVGVYFIYRICTSDTRKLTVGIIGILTSLICVGLAGVQLIPTLELIFNAARSSQEYGFLIHTLLLQPYQLVLFLAPDIFGNPATRSYLINDTYPGNAIYLGIIPFIFALISLVNFRKNSFIRFFTVSTIVMVVLFTSNPLSQIFYKTNVPFFSTGSPTNAIFLLSFCLAVLAGFGADVWLKKTQKKDIAIAFILLVILGVYIIFGPLVHIPISIKNSILSVVFIFSFIAISFLSIKFSKRKEIFFILLIGITIFDLFYYFQKFNSFTPVSLVYPKTSILSFLQEKTGMNRFWGYKDAHIDANFATQYSLFDPDGYDPLYPKWYGEFIGSSKDGKILEKFTNQNRSDAVIDFDDMNNRYSEKILNVLGVKYILDRSSNGSTEKTFPPNKYELIKKIDEWRVFENKNALDRIFFVNNYAIASTKKQFEDIFFSTAFDSSKTVILEEKPEITTPINSSPSSVKVKNYQSNLIELQTNTSSPKILVISDTYFPGWNAFIDGKITKIYKANYAFRSVVVPKGQHTIKFLYQPDSFAWGLNLTIISIVLFSCFIGFMKLFYEKDK